VKDYAESGPVLTTDRFELWRPAASDLEDLVRLLSDDETRRYLGPAQHDARSVYERLQRNAGSWALHGYGTFPVRLRGSGEIIANCGVFHSWRGFGKGMDDVPEAGWIVRRDWWGKGLAAEVVPAALAWFDTVHGARRIACMIEQGNIASERIAALAGFNWYADHREDGVNSPLVNLYERVSGAASRS